MAALISPSVYAIADAIALGGRSVAAADANVDVIAVGPIYPTRNKKNPEPVVGLELLRRARAMTEKPLVAIGGIDADNLGDVLSAGADTVAVLGAACREPIEESCKRLLGAAEGHR